MTSRSARYHVRFAVGLLSAACATLLLITGCSNGASNPNGSGGSAASGNSFENAIKQTGKLSVGVASAPPMIVQDAATGQWNGPYPEFVEYWAKQLDVQVQWVQTTFASMVAGIQARSFDIGLDLSQTPVREEAIAFSNPLSFDVGTLIVKKSLAQGQSFEQFNNASHKACVVSGTSYEEAVTAGQLKLAMSTLALPSVLNCETALDTGRVDSILYGWTAGANYAKDRPDVGLLFPAQPYVKVNVGIGLAKGNQAMLDSLNAAITAWLADPSGKAAAMARSGAVKPLDYAIQPVPQWAQDVSKSQFGV